MTEGSISNVLQKVLDNLEKQMLYLETLQTNKGKYNSHETWNFHEENFACYEEDDSHKYPHLFHTENPQLSLYVSLYNKKLMLSKIPSKNR
jgi:hypothetical protein